MTRAEAIAALTAPGQPFELIEREVLGAPCRVFLRAPHIVRDLLERARAEFGDYPYLTYEGETLSFAEVHGRAARLSWALQERFGVAKGDRVAIAARNYPEWVIAFFATTNLGAIVVALNAWWTAAELEQALEDSGARVVFADAERLQRLGVTSGVDIIAVRTSAPEAIGYDALLDAEARTEPPQAVVEPDDDAFIIYTSGSTAAPKGAVSSHRNIVHALESWRLDTEATAMSEGRVEPREPFEEQRSLLLSVPLFHVSGSHVGMLGCLNNGRRLILMYKWDVARAMELIERERVSMFIAAPAITGDLVRAAEAEGRRLDSLLVIGGGGAPRAPDQVRAIARATAAAPTTGWGMTETNAIGAGVGGPGYLQRPEGVGWPSAVLDLRVVDPEGRELASGEAGELQVRGAAIFRGYWRRPEENATAFQDGWFRTGDLARFDSDGFVYILDRLKDIVIRGGENISCPWVEAALYEHPAVVEAAVFGIPDARLGEELAATVVTTSDAPSEGELRDWLGQRLAAFQVPRRIETRREPLPRTASGKLAKRLIRQEWLARALHQETA